jgi:DNA sulfur modification protein DndB
MASTFNAVKGQQNNTQFFLANFTYGDIKNLVVLPDAKEANDLLNGMQRSLTWPRVKDMKEYLVSDANAFYSALTLFLIPMDFSAIKEGPGGYSFKLLGDEVGELKWEGDCFLFPGDGQHRAASIHEALKANPKLASERIPVVLIPYAGEPDLVRQLFSDLNLNAKPANKTIAIAFDTRDFIVHVTKEVASQVELFNGRANPRSNSISDTSTDVITLNTLYEATIEMLESITGKKRAALSKEPHANAAALVPQLTSVWNTIIAALPGWKEVIAGTHPNELRKKFVHPHGIGWQAIAKATAVIIRKEGYGWRDSLPSILPAVLNSVDWQKTNADWQGVAMNGARVNNTGPGVKATAAYILERGGVDASSDPTAQTLMTQLSKTREAARSAVAPAPPPVVQ